MKRLFSTPKRAVISVVCMVAVIAVVSVIAVKSILITKAEAKAVALGDAGLAEAEVSALRARLEFDDGRFQYEVDFYSNGIEYEYLIQAKDGDIIARDIEGGANGNHYGQNTLPDAGNQLAVDGDGSMQQKEAGAPSVAGGNGSAQQGEAGAPSVADGNGSVEPQGNTGNPSAADRIGTAQSQGYSVDEAKAAALSDAGLSESDVTFKKTELDHEKGIQVYDIEFYTSDAEYEYEINASDLTVLKKNVESFRDKTNPAGSVADGSGNNYIGVDRAKEIALNHANLEEADVRFAKAKLENDDGRAEYEIEFYSGRTEYDYSIDAVSGDIIEYEVDYD